MDKFHFQAVAVVACLTLLRSESDLDAISTAKSQVVPTIRL